MVDAIASHKQKRALELYYDLLALKEPAMRIMYLISRQFNILMNVKARTNKGFGNKDVYKRQHMPFIRCSTLPPSKYMILASSPPSSIATSVSYTHLDVYKRQV